MSDSNGFIYDPNGINLDVVKDIKEVKRGRIKEYAERVPGSVYTEGQLRGAPSATSLCRAQPRTS